MFSRNSPLWRSGGPVSRLRLVMFRVWDLMVSSHSQSHSVILCPATARPSRSWGHYSVGVGPEGRESRSLICFWRYLLCDNCCAWADRRWRGGAPSPYTERISIRRQAWLWTSLMGQTHPACCGISEILMDSESPVIHLPPTTTCVLPPSRFPTSRVRIPQPVRRSSSSPASSYRPLPSY